MQDYNLAHVLRVTPNQQDFFVCLTQGWNSSGRGSIRVKMPAKIENWGKALRKGSRGRQVLANVRDDEKVPGPIQTLVFDHLSGTFPGKISDPLQAFDMALEAQHVSACAGPDAKPPTMALLTRFTPLRFLLDQEDARKKGYSAPIIRGRPSLLRRIAFLSLGRHPRYIVWTALEDPVSEDINAGTEIREIINRLGIRLGSLGPMVQMTYGMDDVRSGLKVPTVFDAGSYDAFRPSPVGTPCGMTHPCDGQGAGYPEYVHKGCRVENPKLDLHEMS